MSDDPETKPRRRRPPLSRDEMCRSLVRAWSELHDVLIGIASDQGLSEAERAQLATDWLVIPPEWHTVLDHIKTELSGLLDEIDAAPEWKPTMDDIAREMLDAWREQLGHRHSRGSEKDA